MSRPLGFYVLIEMQEVQEVSDGGIVLAIDKKREQDAVDIGVVKAIGPIAFCGLDGCDPNRYPPSHPYHKAAPHEIWGVKVGDKVEYRRYEGKLSNAGKNLRYIPDTQIIGVIDND